MSNLEFSLTMVVVGMGGTLAVLTLFAVLMSVLKRLFPHNDNESEGPQ